MIPARVGTGLPPYSIRMQRPRNLASVGRSPTTSSNSVEAPYVHQEIGWALKGKKLIIPLVQPGIPTDRLAMLQGVEYIPFDFQNPQAGHAQLRIALRRLVNKREEKQQAKENAAIVALACVALILLTLDG